MLFILLVSLMPIIYGLTSSDFYEYQLKTLKIKWIEIENDGPVNVTVDYDKDSLVFGIETFWWVNGRLITDGDYNFRVNQFSIHRDNGLSNTGISWSSAYPIDEYINRASILIPPGFNVQSLKLQLVTDILDILLDIHVLTPPPGKSVMEYIPEYESTIEPKHAVTYDAGEKVYFKLFFTAKDLAELPFEDFKAELISMNPCTTPALLETKTSDRNGDFLHLYIPNYDDDHMSWTETFSMGDDSRKVKLLNVSYTSGEGLPKGIVKVTAGYTSTSSCRLFGGVKVTHYTFVNPRPIVTDTYFPEDSVAFLNTRVNYHAELGETIDVSLTAVGSKLTETGYWRDLTVTYPEIWLIKDGENVTAIADIKHIFQNEAVFRFKDLTTAQSGNYLAVAKMGNGTASMSFNIYVDNVSPICGA